MFFLLRHKTLHICIWDLCVFSVAQTPREPTPKCLPPPDERGRLRRVHGVARGRWAPPPGLAMVRANPHLGCPTGRPGPAGCPGAFPRLRPARQQRLSRAAWRGRVGAESNLSRVMASMPRVMSRGMGNRVAMSSEPGKSLQIPYTRLCLSKKNKAICKQPR